MIKVDDLNTFNHTFLSLTSKICDSACIKVDQNKIFSLTCSSDSTIVIFSTYKQQNEIDGVLNLNIPDLNRLSRTLSCIKDNQVQLDVDSNCIKYKSPSVRFTYHLLEDGIIAVPSVSIDKIKKLDFKYSFRVNKTDILSLIKGSSLVTDVDKLYFYVEDDHVYAEITDKETSNTDSYTQKIADQYEGEDAFDQMSISFEILRIISSLKFDDIRIKVNTDVNVLLFEVEIENVKHNFICTTYVR